MARIAEFSRRLLIVIIAAAAVLQWSVVGERVWAAFWVWYKFTGYGGGGQIVVGRTTQAAFIVGSGLLVVVGYLLSKAESANAPKVWKVAAQFGWLSIVVCTLLWGTFLLSPLVAFQPGS